MEMLAGSNRRDDDLISEVADTLALFMEQAPTRKALLSQPQVTIQHLTKAKANETSSIPIF